jgi:DNA polymerase-3 subunit delta'
MAKAKDHIFSLKPSEHQMETIAGHGLLKKLIQRLIRARTLPHAMLFHGPSGLGKRSFSYAVAKFINCTGEQGSATCLCNVCSKIARGTFIDLTVLRPEGSGRVIKIEKIRALQEQAYITPTESEKKIVLFLDAERMSVGAANSLLKILEEPPKHLIMILTTTNPHNLLPTTRSRCMPFRFSPLPTKELMAWLMENHDIDAPLAELASLLSEGRPGNALEVVSGEFTRRRDELIRELNLLDRHGFPSVFRVAGKIVENAGNLSVALNDLLIWYRDLLVSRLVPEVPDLLINKDLETTLVQRSLHLPVNGLYNSFHTILDRQELSHRIIDVNLALLTIMMDIGAALKKN